MNHLLEALVREIGALPRHPDDRHWGAGAVDEQTIENAVVAARELLGADLDHEYLQLARVQDRLSLDGRWVLSVRAQRPAFVMEASDQPEIVNKTLAMSCTLPLNQRSNWVWYGWGDLDYLVYNRAVGRFELRGCESWNTVTHASNSFASAVYAMFKPRLEFASRAEQR